MAEARVQFERARANGVGGMARVLSANGLAIVAAREGRFEEAERFGREAVSVANKGEWPIRRADAHLALAEALLLAGDTAEAAARARAALALAEPKEYGPGAERARALLARLQVPA